MPQQARGCYPAWLLPLEAHLASSRLRHAWSRNMRQTTNAKQQASGMSLWSIMAAARTRDGLEVRLEALRVLSTQLAAHATGAADHHGHLW